MKRAVIVGGAPIDNYEFVKSRIMPDDFFVYCDSGLKHLEALDRKPQLIVGDFDSYQQPSLAVETVVLPCKKDDTDTFYGVKAALERGFDEFLLIGAVGKRFDHSLSNAAILLYLYNRGKNAQLIDDYSVMEAVGNTPAVIEETAKYFSLIPLTGTVNGVNIVNAEYPLKNAQISPDYPYNVSNKPLSGGSTVWVNEGTMLLIKIYSE